MDNPKKGSIQGLNLLASLGGGPGCRDKSFTLAFCRAAFS